MQYSLSVATKIRYVVIFFQNSNLHSIDHLWQLTSDTDSTHVFQPHAHCDFPVSCCSFRSYHLRADTLKVHQERGKANPQVHRTLLKCRAPRPVHLCVCHCRDSELRCHPGQCGADRVGTWASWGAMQCLEAQERSGEGRKKGRKKKGDGMGRQDLEFSYRFWYDISSEIISHGHSVS